MLPSCYVCGADKLDLQHVSGTSLGHTDTMPYERATTNIPMLCWHVGNSSTAFKRLLFTIETLLMCLRSPQLHRAWARTLQAVRQVLGRNASRADELDVGQSAQHRNLLSSLSMITESLGPVATVPC